MSTNNFEFLTETFYLFHQYIVKLTTITRTWKNCTKICIRYCFSFVSRYFLQFLQKAPKIVSLLFSSIDLSILSFLFKGSLRLFLAEDFFRFSVASFDEDDDDASDDSSAAAFGGLRAAKIKFFECFGPDPAFVDEVPFVISASFSRVDESRAKNEPLLFPV